MMAEQKETPILIPTSQLLLVAKNVAVVCVEEFTAKHKNCRGRAETDGTSLKSLFKKITEYPAFSGTQIDQQHQQEHGQSTA